MQPRKILFVSVPADGHFNPLTGLAAHLKDKGHDVRWYTQKLYREKIEKLGIPFYGFVRPPQLNQHNFESFFGERKKISSKVKKLQFDLENVFIRRSAEYYLDLVQIRQTFPFDLVIADIMSTVIPFVKHKLRIPVISVGVLPLAQTSIDLPPAGLGLTPPKNSIERLVNSLKRNFVNKLVFGSSSKLYRLILKSEGIETGKFANMFDLLYRSSDIVLQSGTPGFEYRRTDLPENIKFAGPLLPFRPQQLSSFYLPYHYRRYKRKLLVTQGTVEKNPAKIIEPTLRAFRNTDTLVIATTGGNGTRELREKFPDQNFIIEDFIPFVDLMPYCDVFITNGGYGGVLQAIEHKLPMVVAGIHEGKADINARIGYFELGVNLKTEFPKAEALRAGVETVTGDAKFGNNVKKLSLEFTRYNPYEILDHYLEQLTGKIRTSPLSRNHDVAISGRHVTIAQTIFQ